MRLFHVSEEADIKVFYPRKPYRKDLQDSPGLVWAIDEERLPNFLTPRDCPRVTYHIPINYQETVDESLFSSSSARHVVAIEADWFKRMLSTTLYLYEFDPSDFYVQDDIAGYYVSETEQVPIGRHRITDLFGELFDRNVEVRILDSLQDLRQQVMKTDLNWSMCRMANAKSN